MGKDWVVMGKALGEMGWVVLGLRVLVLGSAPVGFVREGLEGSSA